MTAQPSRPGRLGTTTGRLAAAAIVLLVAILAVTQLPRLLVGERASASPTPSPSASPTASAEPTTSPTGDATDSPGPSPTPGSGELPTGAGDALMSFRASCDVVPPINVPETTVLTDGRVIWFDGEGGLLVRQLTPASLADFTEQVRSTGLFEASGHYALERRPGTPEPPGHGLCVWAFTWNDGGDDAEVVSIMWLGEQEESMYYEPAPERKVLHELATQLQEPTAWYGEDGWVQPEAVAYEPQEYLVLAGVGPIQMAAQGAPDLEDVSWPFDEPPDAFGVQFGFAEPPARCGIADAQAIEALAAELTAAGLEQFDASPFFGHGVALPWQAEGLAVDFSLWPVLPDGRPTCETPD